jgi:hypothetical protein
LLDLIPLHFQNGHNNGRFTFETAVPLNPESRSSLKIRLDF